jgi:hypothetical protein
MKIFECPHCLNPLAFESTHCERCGHAVGYLNQYSELKLLVQGEHGKIYSEEGRTYQYCQHHQHGVCNWLVPTDSVHSLCDVCLLDQNLSGITSEEQRVTWKKMEQAKHRLIYSLNRLNLPVVSKSDAPDHGLSFEFLTEEYPSSPVRNGYSNGLITINLARADAGSTGSLRHRIEEHHGSIMSFLRHEIGHYYWEQLVLSNRAILQTFRELFGDEIPDYDQALDQHHQIGPPDNWQKDYSSKYATFHARADWAETWSHYLYLMDLLESAYALGLSIRPNLQSASSMSMYASFDPYKETEFEKILDAVIPLTFAVSHLNQRTEQPNLYSFSIPEPVIRKLRFVHQLLHSFEN